MTTAKSKKSSIEVKAVDSVTEDTRDVFLLALTSFSGTLGFILFITGCVVTSQYNLLLDFITVKYTESSVFLILLGIVVAIVSSIGFYASLKSHYVLMITYLTAMIICVICEAMGSITMFAQNQDGQQQTLIMDKLETSLKEYDVTPDSMTDAWDMIQTDLECCGVSGPRDFRRSPFFREKNHLPVSCCGSLVLDVQGQAEKCRTSTPTVYNRGCHEAVEQFLKGKMGALGGVAALVAVLQIMIISTATILIGKWTRPSHCYPCY